MGILNRALQTLEGFKFVKNEVNSTTDVFIRDEGGFQAFYEPISVIEFMGNVTRTGQSNGHYICDIKEIETKAWFRTNDDRDPTEIPVSAVSKLAYVVLYK